MKRQLSLLISCCCAILSTAQIGGDNIYEFLNFAPSARVTALGEHLITVRDNDVSLAYANPSVLNSEMHGQLSFNHSFHLAGIQYGYASYGHHLETWNTTLHGGIQYVNYGELDAADQFGNRTGTFKAAEYAITLGGARQLYERLSIGANAKFISSQFESYNSIGISADLAAMYHDTTRQFNLTLLFKNIGQQLTTYVPDQQEDLPFEIQAGLSKRLRYLPFRFSIIYRYLNRANILYDDPNNRESNSILGEAEPGPSAIDKFFRHFVFSGEFLFGKRDNFRLRVGYNHLRHQELKVTGLRSLAGFSFGFGINIKRFRVDYGQGFYHLAGSIRQFSISTSLQEFK